MFKLELDLHLRFVPPMEEHREGFVFTRTIELPFPPVSGLRIAGRDIDECPDPIGFDLRDVTWDIDRQVFLAHSSLTVMKEPLGLIPSYLRSYVDLGWKLGSYTDSYNTIDEEADQSAEEDVDESDDEFDRLERLHLLPRNRRDREFNEFFKAVVRYMADTHNNLEVAFAMDKTGRLAPDESVRGQEQWLEKWYEAIASFNEMTMESQIAWHERCQKYPSIEEALSLG